MKIRLKIPDMDIREYETNPGSTIESIYEGVKEQAPYDCVAAKVDNDYRSLSSSIDKECVVELLDMRNKGACRIYQASLSLLFVAAASKVIPKSLCEIANSLNRGLFIELKTNGGSTDEIAQKIELEMKDMVGRNIEIKREYPSGEEALSIARDVGDRAKSMLIKRGDDMSGFRFYSLDGYMDFFCSEMVPSTGYLKRFTLEKYKRGLLLRFPDKYDPAGIPKYVDEPNMYKAFGEQNEWDRLMGVSYVPELNSKIESGEGRDLVQLSEALHDKRLTEIANLISEEGRRLVLIAGPSSSGKTTFAKRLCVHLRVNGHKALYMGTDDYFVDRKDMIPDEKGEFDYEGLEAVDVDLFNNNMKALLDGEEVDLPEFDFLDGKKVFGKRVTKIDDSTVIVIEGIHALNEVMTSDIPREDKFKIYISPLTQLNIDAHNRVPTTDERLLRRIVRDDRTRGRDAAETIKTWPAVRRGEDRNIFKYCDEADVMFNSYHIYEISVLKKYAEPLLSAISKEKEEYAEAQRILDFLRVFRTIEDDSIIVNDSILREFIGGSVYVN